MSEYQKRIEELEQQVKKLRAELQDWEQHNDKENDLMRDDIKSLKKLQNKIKKLDKMSKKRG